MIKKTVTIFFLLCSLVNAGQSLPLPRFVSLRSGEVNLRVGPGSEYPVEWIFKRDKMPVEIITEFGAWRKIRDFEGAEGWVHQSMLSGGRTLIITGNNVILRKNPDTQATGVARLEISLVGKLIECKGDWCRLQTEGYKGWLPRSDVWGVYSHEFRN